MLDLYDRQKSLGLNIDQSITVIGCGGVGFWVVKLLALAGVDKIYAFDPDVIDYHNLNRLDIPERFVGDNKADVIRTVVNVLRPSCTIYTFPYVFSEVHDTGTDWLVDCTDNHESQLENQRIAKSRGMKYMKVGYDGNHITIANSVAEWGDDEDGYNVVPSFVVPAVVVAGLAVDKILKGHRKEVSSDIVDLFNHYEGI
jgi:Zn-dependent alcohol dehydrogenase